MLDEPAPLAPSGVETYDAEYYASHCGLFYGRQEPHWGHFFGGIAEQIVRSLRPRRVFDAGCAHGFLLEALWDRGVEAWGRDISHFAVSEVRADLRSFVAQGSVADAIEGEYDLVTCIEVLEHMEEAEAVRAIASVAAATPRLLFSSSPTDLEEATHVNVKPVIWWLRRFAEAGMAPAADYDASFLTPHAYLLERSAEGRSERELAAFAELIRQRLLAHERAMRLVAAEAEQARGREAATQAAAGAALAERARLEAAAQAAAARAEAEQARGREAAAQAAAGAALAERARLEAAAGQAARDAMAAQMQAAAMHPELVRLREQASAAAGAALAERARFEAEAEQARGREAAAQSDGVAARLARDALLYSTTWRATQPLRRAAAALPVPARRALRRMVRAGYWMGTGQFGRRMAERRAPPAGRAAAPLQLVSATPPEPPAETDYDRTVREHDALTEDDLAAAPLQLVSAAPLEPPAETEYDRWVREHDALTEDDRAAIRAHIARLTRRPLISVVMPAYETPGHLLREAITSVRAQLYPHWELCVADDASPSRAVSRVLDELAAAEPRIRWMRRERNGHIAAATNSALALARGEFVALMDHDDLLPEQALYEAAVALDAHPDTDLLFTDEDQVDAAGRRHTPYFKPDFNIDLLLAHNMVSHLSVYRRSVLERLGGLREGLVDGSQDYDLALRTVAACGPARIRHIPAVLYHWRRMDENSSFSQTQLDHCVLAAAQAIGDHLAECGVQGAELLPAPAAPLWTRVRWPLPDPTPRVSLIMPTRDQPELLSRSAAGLLHRTDYPNLELLIVDNGSADPAALRLLKRFGHDRRVRVLPFPRPFNYSALNNAAVREATGEVVVLVNNDIDVIDDGWLREMVSHAVRPDVGAVGAKLLYGDGRIQHAGVVLGVGTHRGGPGVAGHFGHFAGGDDGGYFGQFILARELSAVTGACLALRKSVYEMVGGLDEARLPVSFNDVDLCLRIRTHGLRVIWTPFAELYHLESASRGQDRTPEQIARAADEADVMRERWGPVLDADPFYNPAFNRVDHQFRLGWPPRRARPWRQPPA